MCLLGGSPIGKASKKFGIPKVMLDGNKLEICKNDWVNWRRRKKLLYRTCGFHQPHIHTFCENTCLECLKSQQPNGFNTETEPGDKLYNKFKKRNKLSNRKPDNIDCLILDSGWLILLCMNNNLHFVGKRHQWFGRQRSL